MRFNDKRVERAESNILRELASTRRDLKKKRDLETGKVCANASCLDAGKILSPEWFYRRGKERLDSYCKLCRKEMVKMRRENAEFIPSDGTKIPRVKKWALKESDGEINVGKAPWCNDHHRNSSKCGCAVGRFHKSPEHKKKISEAQKGNSYARGNSYKNGPMTSEHRARIAMAMRISHMKKKIATDAK